MQDPNLPDGCKQSDIDALSMSDRHQAIAEDVEGIHEEVNSIIWNVQTFHEHLLNSIINMMDAQREAVRSLRKLRENVKYYNLQNDIDDLINRIEWPEIEEPEFDLCFPALGEAIADAIEEEESNGV